jgi:hypothetical protein
MNSEFWGPHAWIFLHTISFWYPKEPSQMDKENMYNFIQSFSKVIPCGICRDNFNKHKEECDLFRALQSRSLFVEWMYKMHDKVNKMVGKESPPLSYVKAFYESKRAGVKKQNIDRNIINRLMEVFENTLWNYQFYTLIEETLMTSLVNDIKQYLLKYYKNNENTKKDKDELLMLIEKYINEEIDSGDKDKYMIQIEIINEIINKLRNVSDDIIEIKGGTIYKKKSIKSRKMSQKRKSRKMSQKRKSKNKNKIKIK